MQNLIELRHILHAHPELSGQEALTNRILNEWVKQTCPDRIIEKIGGYGLAAIYKGTRPVKRILIRGDIDALHIPEPNDLPYRSQNQGVSHKCGHDGHATILCGLAQWLRATPRPRRSGTAFPARRRNRTRRTSHHRRPSIRANQARCGLRAAQPARFRQR